MCSASSGRFRRLCDGRATTEAVASDEAGDANVARGDTFGQRSCLDSFLIILSNIKKINPSFVLECFFDMMQGY